MSQTANDGFESASYLTAFAKSEIDDFESLIERFYQDNPTTVVEEFNSDTQSTDYVIPIAPLPFRLRGMSSNVIKNLRDALDQAVNAAHHIMGTPCRDNHFPFGTNPNDLDAALRHGRCKNIPEELFPALRSYEPYPTGDNHSGGDNLLRLLGKISGFHKHRTTLIVTAKPVGAQIGFSDLNVGKGGFSIFPYLSDGPRADKIILASFGDGCQGNVNIGSSTYIAFAYPELRDIEALKFLRVCHGKVLHIVQDLQSQAFSIGPRA